MASADARRGRRGRGRRRRWRPRGCVAAWISSVRVLRGGVAPLGGDYVPDRERFHEIGARLRRCSSKPASACAVVGPPVGASPLRGRLGAGARRRRGGGRRLDPDRQRRSSSTARAARAARGAVRLRGDRIAEVGDCARPPGETVVDAHGLVLAPGFIDTHSHADRGLFEHRDALAAVSQGITTIVAGQDGGSPWPLCDFFARLEAAAGRGQRRRLRGPRHASATRCMGADFRRARHRRTSWRACAPARSRAATRARSASPPGSNTTPASTPRRAELIDAGAGRGGAGGRYISHVRSEDRHFWEAIDEILAIGREAKLPVQVSHVKLAMRSLWGQATALLAHARRRARSAGIDVTADIYPYLYWQSTLTVLFPERDFETSPDAPSSCCARSRRRRPAARPLRAPALATRARPWPRSRAARRAAGGAR